MNEGLSGLGTSLFHLDGVPRLDPDASETGSYQGSLSVRGRVLDVPPIVAFRIGILIYGF